MDSDKKLEIDKLLAQNVEENSELNNVSDTEFMSSLETQDIIDNAIGDECYIEKQKMITKPEFKLETVAECRVPMAEFNKAYDLLLEFVQNMCNSNDDDDLVLKKKEAINIMLKYCKSSEE